MNLREVPPGETHALAKLFSPDSIAIVGASPDFARYGSRVLQYTKAFGFRGDVWPVNPRYDEVMGYRCFPTLRDLPAVPDHVGIAVAHEHLVKVLDDCAGLGVSFATIFTAGYSELGTEEGRIRQAYLTDFARETGIRILGPNCNGVINWHRRFSLAGTAAVVGTEGHPAGRVAIVSQSGGGGAVNVMYRAIQAGIGISHHASCGNEADIDMLDICDFLIGDPDTSIILLFAERISDGAKLADVGARAATAGKPILVQKLGRSEAGSKAAASHTGSLTGRDDVHDAAFRQLGLIRVDDPRHLYQAAMMFLQDRPLEAEGVSAVSASGGNVVLAADLGERFEIDFPEYSTDTRARIAKFVPGFINFSNPSDLSPQVISNASNFQGVMEGIAADPSIGVLLPILTLSPQKDAKQVLAVARALDKPVAVVWSGGCTDGPSPLTDRLEDGVPVYRDIEAAMMSTRALIDHARIVKRFAISGRPPRPSGMDPRKARAIIAAAPAGPVNELLSKQVLAAYGIPVVRETLAASSEGVRAAIQGFSGPLAAKILSPDILHKTEAHAVMLGVNPRDAEAAFETIKANARSYNADARIDGVLFQEMVPQGLEMILGLSTDPTYGPVIALGLGGLLVEAFRDVALRLPPLTPEEADEMIDELRSAVLLGPLRGSPARDRAALRDVLVRFSWLASDLADLVEEIDVNPVIVGFEGSGLIAVDALLCKPQAL